MQCSDKIHTIMSFIEEYCNKLSNELNKVLNIVICCNKNEDAIPDSDINRHRYKRSQSIYNDKNLILPKNADAYTSVYGIVEETDNININIDDNILKIKKDLEESMSFKYHSDLLKSPRTPV
jgi:hypothetical protein